MPAPTTDADIAIGVLRRTLDTPALLDATAAELGEDPARTHAQICAQLDAIAADPTPPEHGGCTIVGAVHAMSTRLERPDHIAPIAEALHQAHEAAAGRAKPLRVCISAPPQTGKTTVVQHGEAWWLRRRPQDWIAHVSYGALLAESKSRGVRDLARRLGVRLREDSQSVQTWQTVDGGGFLARGRGGAITGQEGIKLAVLDDPYSQMTEAQSRHMRDRIDTDFRAVLMSRVHPDTSVIVQHTRFHEDDQIGRLSKEGWRVVNLPAVDPVTGESFWRSRSREFWAQVRREVHEPTWWSLYMGEPRPREGRAFREVYWYDGSPPPGMRVAIGIDLAYSAKTSADWSVAIVMGTDTGERWYVLDMIRRQCEAPVFAAELQKLRAAWPGAPIRWYASGPELGTAHMMSGLGVHVNAIPPHGDKVTRAIPVAAAWNRGAVLLPRERSWTDAMVGEVLDFSGIGDAHDDIVDALAAAFDALAAGSGSLAYSPTGGVHRGAKPYEGAPSAVDLLRGGRRGRPW